jgi:hexosaminidase
MAGMAKRSWAVAGVLCVVAAVTAVVVFRSQSGEAPAVQRDISWGDVLPAPVSAVATDATFTLTDGAPIVTQQGSDAAAGVGDYLAALLGHRTTGRPGAEQPAGGIALLIDESAPEGDEAYQLDISAGGVTVRARSAAGLFWGVQTLRQLMPGDLTRSIVVPGGRIVDRPRFPYRGVMLDVARHFFDVATVKRLIDLSTMYKVNYLHLHLTDDQGWRIAVESWPRLTTHGGGSEVGGGPGGYYTKDDYREIVAYAAERFMTVVPEVDLPGHTNAALASYAELNCDGKAPERYIGIDVGFSALCANDDDTDRFLGDVLGELAELTPGPYLHIGGDEASRMSADDYAKIVTRAQEIVTARGKTVVGWHQLAEATLADSTVLQFWDTATIAPDVVKAAAAGHKVIMSPANHAYLDQKYDDGTRIGLQWAGPTSVQKAYGWDPTTHVLGIGEQAVLGVESPLWTETVTSIDDIEYLAFPRLAASAEIGWSPASTHDWTAFRVRLGGQAPRWAALGVDFARTDDVPWVAV